MLFNFSAYSLWVKTTFIYKSAKLKRSHMNMSSGEHFILNTVC